MPTGERLKTQTKDKYYDYQNTTLSTNVKVK